MSKSNHNILIFLLLVMISCNADKKFDKQKWLANPDVNDRYNPRAYMTEDLMKNYLKVGLAKNAVLALLGKPDKDGIENRLPKGHKIPDSLSFTNEENLKPERRNKVITQMNEFVRLNAIPNSLMSYPVGWSTADANFLVLQFDEKGIVSDFWVEQH